MASLISMRLPVQHGLLRYRTVDVHADTGVYGSLNYRGTCSDFIRSLEYHLVRGVDGTWRGFWRDDEGVMSDEEVDACKTIGGGTPLLDLVERCVRAARVAMEGVD